MSHLDAFCVTGSSPTAGPRDRRIDLDPPRFLTCRIHGPDGAPPVLVLGGISAGRYVAEEPGSRGWWSSVVGPGRTIDTTAYRVIGVDYLGGIGASWHPPEGEVVTARDQASALVAALDGLAVDEPATVVGASYGGAVALALGALAPERCRRLVVLCAAHRTHPLASAVRRIQRHIVSWGREIGRPDDGVALARSLAMTTYRTAAEFEGRFADADAASEYLSARGRSFARACDPEAYHCLSASLDASRVDPGDVRVQTTIVGSRSDTLVPPWLIEELAGAIAGSTELHWLDSVYGHDAFLKEPAALDAILRPIIDTDGPRSVTPEPRPAASHPAGRTFGAGLRTRTVRAGVGADPGYGAVMPPIHLSVNYAFPEIGSEPPYDYARSGNPNRDLLARAIADLEGGSDAVVTSSGLGAATLVLSTLPAGSLVVAPRDCYGGTRRLLDAFAGRRTLAVEYEDLWTEAGRARAIEAEPALIWIESPSNPLLRITDVESVCAAGRERGARTLVDNTFLSPVLQRPLELGADLVLHSTTKLLNGHSDVVGGAIVAADPGAAEELRWWGNCLGVTGSPFDSYLTLRGLRTIHARVETAERNAAAVVAVLDGHPAVSRVFYPGLAAHGGHEVAARQQSGFGSLATFELRGGRPAATAVARALEHFTLAESLGGVESLVCHPETMTHAALTPEARAEAGINGAQLRLSMGIEATHDLVRDLENALDHAGTAGRPA